MTTDLTLFGMNLKQFNPDEQKLLGETFSSFVESSVTASSRATFYNSVKEQSDAIKKLHEELLKIERGIYALFMMLPGLTDYTKQTGLRMILSNPYNNPGILTQDEETKVLEWIAGSLPPQRMLNSFIELKEVKINNSRTQRVILKTILNSPKLELWSTKYRSKIRTCFIHALGERQCGILISILKKEEDKRNIKEIKILEKYLDRYLSDKIFKETVYECFRFIFKHEDNLLLPLLKAYVNAKNDLVAGKVLPFEVLEGIRSTYHPDIACEETLKLTKWNLTQSQQITMQRKAEKSGVEVKFKPDNYDMVKLYLYAYEMGMTDEIRSAIRKKAMESAYIFNLENKKAGILIDGSQSMLGSQTQKMRPIATALAMRDVISAAAKESVIIYAGGRRDETNDLIYPQGETSLAESLVGLIMQQPDTIFILTDGYENSPAGRIDEIIRMAEELGSKIPVVQYSPVMAAESSGIRQLSESISALPVSAPETATIGMLKESFTRDPEHGLRILLKIARPHLESAKITRLLN